MRVKGMRRVNLAGGRLHVFSDARRVVLQVRVKGSDSDPLPTWVKAAVELDGAEASQVAAELLRAAAVVATEKGKRKEGTEHGS